MFVDVAKCDGDNKAAPHLPGILQPEMRAACIPISSPEGLHDPHTNIYPSTSTFPPARKETDPCKEGPRQPDLLRNKVNTVNGLTAWPKPSTLVTPLLKRGHSAIQSQGTPPLFMARICCD